MKAPDVTLIILVEPDGEIRFGPTKMKHLGGNRWAIPGCTWTPDMSLTLVGAQALITLAGQSKQVELPVEWTGTTVVPGRPLRLDFSGSIFELDRGLVH